VASAVERVVTVLGELGHDVDEGPALEGTIDQFLPLFQFLAANAPVPVEGMLEPSTRWLRSVGREVSFGDAEAQRKRFERRVEAWFQDADAWVTPTVALSPPSVGQWRGRPGRDTFVEVAPLGAFTAAVNASGHPAISIPVWVKGHPLPVGVQIIGRHGSDGELLALARAIMIALSDRVAPLAPSRTP
jgi:amidase